MLLLTSFSDWKQTRGIPAACIFLVGLTGWAILLSVPALHPTPTELHVRYFGCICVVVAGYVNIPIIICEFTSSSTADQQRGSPVTLATSPNAPLLSGC
jgi:hypothetical protein